MRFKKKCDCIWILEKAKKKNRQAMFLQCFLQRVEKLADKSDKVCRCCQNTPRKIKVLLLNPHISEPLPFTMERDKR